MQPFLKKDTVFLEIGPGDCALSLEMTKLVKVVYAVDVSEVVTKQFSSPENFELILSDGVSVPLPKDSVDVAYSNQLMEHLHPDDALEQLHNIYRVLAPGGVYVCITPNSLNGPHDVSRYFDAVATGFHLKEYTVIELARLFKDAGFQKVKILIPIKNTRFFLSLFLSKLFEWLLSVFPYPLRRSLASTWLVSKLLGVRMIGIK